jgi:hypothetical protein
VVATAAGVGGVLGSHPANGGKYANPRRRRRAVYLRVPPDPGLPVMARIRVVLDGDLYAPLRLGEHARGI